MDKQIMATESFSDRDKHYFFDFMQAANGSYYVKISRSDAKEDHIFYKQEVVVFEENFKALLQALSDLFRAAAFQEAANAALPQQPAAERKTGIKSWDAACRPREKLMAQGRDAMADAELLAMLIGSGSPRESAVALAGRILESVDFNLRRLAALPLEELCTFRGMGHAKSLAIIAAMELAGRLAECPVVLG